MAETINTPEITVLMPVFNGEKYLHEAIESILKQTFRNFEFLIINDGSTDNSVAIIDSFTDSRIRLVHNETNLGVIESLNKGIGLAKGTYIARMDCDDISLPQRFEKQIKFLNENPFVCLVAAHILMIDENGNNAGFWAEDMRTVSVAQIKSMLTDENCLAHPTVMIRKEVLSLIKYNETLKHSEDWGLWLTLLSEGFTIAKVDEVLLKYRIHSEGTTVKANLEGVRKKIIRFKFLYLKGKLRILKLKGSDYNVCVSLIKNILKYNFPGLYSFMAKTYSTNPLSLFNQYIYFRRQLKSLKNVKNIFLFPFYHFGGAEIVHLSIIEAVAKSSSIVFFTSYSKGEGLLEEFNKNAKVYKIEQLLNWPLAKRFVIKTIKRECQVNKDVNLFGCNSRFFYELIAYLPDEIKTLDLIHAFMHEYESGPEKWSLPVVGRINTRIVITQAAANNLMSLYQINHLPESLLNRIVYIPNYTDEKPMMKKNLAGKLKIIYVGRGTPEKRVNLITASARITAEKQIPVEFHFIGDVENIVPKEDMPFCILHGEISDKRELYKLYAEAHILVLASSREGFPMVIMEGMMSGVVPVSTNVGGISEHIKNNENGILINETENNAIIEKIIKAIEFLSDNRERLTEMSENAHKYALSNFSKSRFVESYQKLLNH